MEKMNSSVIRLMIFNQFKIMSLLEPGDKDYYEYYMDILIEGIEKRYPDVFEAIGVEGEGVKAEVSDEVDMILELFRKVERSLTHLPKRVREELEETHHVHFNGFNCNSRMEYPYFTYWSFLKRHNERDLPRVQVQSQNLSINHYLAMVSDYKSHGFTELLDETQLRKICIEKGQESDLFRPVNLKPSDVGGMTMAQVVMEDKLYLKEQ